MYIILLYILYNNIYYHSTDEDPSLRIESSAIINLRGVSTKLNKYTVIFTIKMDFLHQIKGILTLAIVNFILASVVLFCIMML